MYSSLISSGFCGMSLHSLWAEAQFWIPGHSPWDEGLHYDFKGREGVRFIKDFGLLDKLCETDSLPTSLG